MAILFIAAEAAELKPFAELLTGLRKLKWPLDYAFEGIWESRRILLAANGAGPKLAAQALEVAIRAGMAKELSSSKLEAVISTGYCGALDPALSDGQIVVADRVVSPATSEEYLCAAVTAPGEFTLGTLLSQDSVVNQASAKAQLFKTGAIAVDMEAAGVAARAKRARLPFSCIKVVSDRADESFPFDLNAMRSTEGRIARGKIVVHALMRPTLLGSLLRLKRRTESVSKTLGEFLVSSRIVAEPISSPADTGA